jgi:1-acyl-sn-glycerol-3-phosphate acyltransferase
VDIVYPPVIGFARLSFRALGLRFLITGEQHVPRAGGAVMASNHVSYLDFTFVGLAARPAKRLVRFMAKHEVFASKAAGPLMRGMHHIPVDRAAGAASYDAALAALRNGEIVGVFPEATISRSFEIKELKTGAARMALEAGVPILPVIVWGGQRLMTKGRPRQLRQRGVTIAIDVGEPLTPYAGEDAVALTARLAARLQEQLEKVQAAYPDVPSGDDDRWWLPVRLGGTSPTPQEAAALDAEEHERRRSRRAEQGS